ncbi:uncharacterized protein LOC112520918 [Cynara cardunculus var. scolymus]|uniref:Uncharacterized protein n=1 Tax=Cynara cardunculus var. scolymus TaxID=59895 RepID=A0A124SHD2_CYNCS|nr:uncharacterized protein LOC112520918 [Cynara cardunculus var. scolymus]KVI09166.1 Protein of unknown function DUF1645 [Cynara cardunculus var. scolymus]
MQNQGQVDDLGFCPSFNCYSSDSLASTAATRVSSQLLQEQVARFHDVGEEDFEFSLVLDDEQVSVRDAASEGRVVFPLFNRDLLVKDEGDREAVQGKVDDDQEDACSASLEKLFITEREESASSSSSEADESESEAPGVFCAWRPKMDIGSSPLSKCKKSSSTGSGSKRWRIRDLLRRSNSEGKEPMVLLTPKKVEVPKQKRKSGEVSIVSGKSKPSIHELFYVQQRAKREDGKRKSYLPYRQGLVGFFTNVNGKGNKFPF